MNKTLNTEAQRHGGIVNSQFEKLCVFVSLCSISFFHKPIINSLCGEPDN